MVLSMAVAVDLPAKVPLHTTAARMNLKEIHYGIEIETVKCTREQIAWAIHSVVGGTVRHIGIPSSYDPWEVEDETATLMGHTRRPTPIDNRRSPHRASVARPETGI